MFYLGLFISLIIGIILGLVGGGGSILTVPLVHYFFGASMLLSTTYSLFVVAVASGLGTIQRIRSKEVEFRKGLIFVLPSMTTAFVIRSYIFPQLPEEFGLFGLSFSLDTLIIVLLLIVLSFTAIKTLSTKKASVLIPAGPGVIALYGVLTGFLSGIIGAGGGFIIVPILLRMGLEIKKAVATSLFIISIQSFVALLGDYFNPKIIQDGGLDWTLMFSITGITVFGVFIGTYLNRYFSGILLRKIFSVILIAVCSGIIFKLIVN